MTIDLYHCWSCQKRLSDDLPFELYFWCNKTCYEKDDLYHGRKKMFSEIAEEENKKKPINTETDTSAEVSKKSTKARRLVTKGKREKRKSK